MKIEFIFIQAVSVLIELLVTHSYFESLLVVDKEKHKSKSKTVLLYIAIFIMLTVIQSLFRNAYIAPISLEFAIILISFLYTGEWKNKLSLSIVLLLIFVLSELGAGMLMSMFSSKSMQIMESNPLLYFQGMFVSKMTAFIIVKIISRFKNRHIYSLKIKSWFGIMLIPVTSVISIYAVAEIAYTIADKRNSMYVLLIAVCLIGANVIAFNLFENELKVEEQRLRVSFLDKHLNEEKEYYKSLAETQKEIRKTSHDMKNLLIAILGSIENGELSIAKNKIHNMIDVYDNSLQTVYTGQLIVDTMINAKYKRMKEKNIVFKPFCIMNSSTDFDYINFCIFLGNALDNAIEACDKLKENKYIKLKIVEKENFLNCYIENSFNGKVLKDNEKTSKPDKTVHGFGFDNMKAIVENNGGSLIVKSEGNRFIVSTIFKI